MRVQCYSRGTSLALVDIQGRPRRLTEHVAWYQRLAPNEPDSVVGHVSGAFHQDQRREISL